MNCRLSEVFSAQISLMERFHQIERKNIPHLPTVYDIPLDLDNPVGQLRAKEYAWRITEEICEALVAGTSLGAHDPIQSDYHEEISDAFHFLIELFVITGVGPSELVKIHDGSCRLDGLYSLCSRTVKSSNTSQEWWWLSFITELGLAMNVLKNRPWKLNHRITDRLQFNSRMKQVLYAFISAAYASGIESAEQLKDVYFQKHRINLQRQKEA